MRTGMLTSGRSSIVTSAIVSAVTNGATESGNFALTVTRSTRDTEMSRSLAPVVAF
jgi:hypothetical protein